MSPRITAARTAEITEKNRNAGKIAGRSGGLFTQRYARTRVATSTFVVARTAPFLVDAPVHRKDETDLRGGILQLSALVHEWEGNTARGVF